MRALSRAGDGIRTASAEHGAPSDTENDSERRLAVVTSRLAELRAEFGDDDVRVRQMAGAVAVLAQTVEHERDGAARLAAEHAASAKRSRATLAASAAERLAAAAAERAESSKRAARYEEECLARIRTAATHIAAAIHAKHLTGRADDVPLSVDDAERLFERHRYDITEEDVLPLEEKLRAILMCRRFNLKREITPLEWHVIDLYEALCAPLASQYLDSTAAAAACERIERNRDAARSRLRDALLAQRA